MATTTTPNLNLTLAVPGSGEPFDTDVVNANFSAIDTMAGTNTATETTQNARLTAVEKFTLPSASSPTTGVVPAGTTAQRDAMWPAPSTAAERVALANKAARWHNTDANFGFEQRYFCPTTDSAEAGYLAQNARGAGGWMPNGKFERGFVRASGPQTLPTAIGAMIPGMTLTVPCSGGKIRITAAIEVSNPISGADRVAAFQAHNDGVAITPNPGQMVVPMFAGATVANPVMLIWEATPTAGSHTFTLHGNAPVVSSVTVGSAGTYMYIEEIAG